MATLLLTLCQFFLARNALKGKSCFDGNKTNNAQNDTYVLAMFIP
jgi:hypothetical protein